VLRITELLPLS